jgi:DNA-binding NarL/FixJ family response regulator
MEARRIILAGESRLWMEMLRRAISKSPGLEVVGQVADLASLPSAVERFGAQWVIMSLQSEATLPEVVGRLLAAHPSLHILALAPDGSQVRLEWMEPHEKIFDQLSLNELVATLRSGRPAGQDCAEMLPEGERAEQAPSQGLSVLVNGERLVVRPVQVAGVDGYLVRLKR